MEIRFKHGKIADIESSLANIEIELSCLRDIASSSASIESSLLEIKFGIEHIEDSTGSSFFDFIIRSLVLALFIGISVAAFLRR